MNGVPRKPALRSPLRRLPEEAQTALIERLKNHPHEQVRRWVRRKHGFTPSIAALSGFWSWWHLKQVFNQTAARVDATLEKLKTACPEIPEEKLADLSHAAFTLLALETQNTKDWARTEKLRLQRRQLEIERRKIALLERKAAQADAAEAAIKDPALTPAEREARLKAVFGMK